MMLPLTGIHSLIRPIDLGCSTSQNLTIMKRILFILPLLLFMQISVAQKKSNVKLFMTKFYSKDAAPKVAVIIGLKDSTIQVITVKDAKAKTAGDRLTSEEIPVNSITRLRITRVGGIKTGALTGGAVGLVLGAVIGNATYTPCDDTPGFLGSDCDWELFDRGDSTIFGAIVGAQLGAGIGILIGASGKTIVLNGDITAYQKTKTQLEKYQLTSNLTQ
jgi:hypothetical protein